MLSISFDGLRGDAAPSPRSPASLGDGKKTQRTASVPIENCLTEGVQSILLGTICLSIRLMAYRPQDTPPRGAEVRAPIYKWPVSPGGMANMRMLRVFEIVGADIRFAIRGLLKNPGFLAVVVLSLALGIAANSTIYSILDTLLYRPLPYPQPEKLVVIWQTEQAHPDQRNAPPIAQQVDWNKQNHVFEDIALISFNDTASVSSLGEPRPRRTHYLTPNLFSLLGAKPIMGRVFLATEAQDKAQTIVISYEFWKRELNSDPQVLGKSFSIEGVVSTIVGVMQPHFSPFYGGRNESWGPLNPASSRHSTANHCW